MKQMNLLDCDLNVLYNKLSVLPLQSIKEPLLTHSQQFYNEAKTQQLLLISNKMKAPQPEQKINDNKSVLNNFYNKYAYQTKFLTRQFLVNNMPIESNRIANELCWSMKEWRASLIPNFQVLNEAVQSQILHALDIILNKQNKNLLQSFSRFSLLQQAPLLRSHIWKLLLGTLSLDPETWSQTKINNNQVYNSLIGKYMSDISQQKIKSRSSQQKDTKKQKNDNEQFDGILWHQIELDTKRTHSSLNFFQKQAHNVCVYDFKPTRNCDVLSRILYIWAKMNPGVRYVQGMNQLLAPLYYLQLHESQVFFMFSALMSFVVEMHVKQVDNTSKGIVGRMHQLNRYLFVADHQLWQKLEQQQIAPHYYSFRWLALLLAQQFGLYQTMKLWDILFSYQGAMRYFYLYSCCLAILNLRKSVLMKNDFITILPLIQKIKDIMIEDVILTANAFYQKYSKISLQKMYNAVVQKKKSSKFKEAYEGILQITHSIWTQIKIKNPFK